MLKVVTRVLVNSPMSIMMPSCQVEYRFQKLFDGGITARDGYIATWKHMSWLMCWMRLRMERERWRRGRSDLHLSSTTALKFESKHQVYRSRFCGCCLSANCLLETQFHVIHSRCCHLVHDDS